MDLRDERELAFQRLLCICQSGLVSITDFRCRPLPMRVSMPWLSAYAPSEWQNIPSYAQIHYQQHSSAVAKEGALLRAASHAWQLSSEA